MYFIRGSLPWQGLKAGTKKQKYEKISERKVAHPLRLYVGVILQSLHHSRSLRFDDKPDNAYLKRLFWDLFIREGFQFDYVFDWTILKYQQSQSANAPSRVIGPGVGPSSGLAHAATNDIDSRVVKMQGLVVGRDLLLQPERTHPRLHKIDTQHQFNARESDWGFTSFMSLSELYDPSRGYLVNDTCVIEAEVTVRKVIDYWSYDSKKETGYVGLENQGATCCMNSLLQTLYHIPYFRKAVYHMPTTENDMPSGSIPLALQSLFYKLQCSYNSVATKELTKSFGWDTYDSFMQHDMQEFNRVLCEKLEDKMKETVVEGTIQDLFEGHHMLHM